MQEQSNKAESLVRLYDSIANAAEALGRLAGEELRGAQAEHLEEEAAAKVSNYQQQFGSCCHYQTCLNSGLHQHLCYVLFMQQCAQQWLC